MTKFVTLTGTAVLLSLSGCVATSPNWDASFGEAVRTTTAQQIISPDASNNPSMVRGIDGKAAQGAMGSYAKSFTAKEPAAPSLTVNVGSN